MPQLSAQDLLTWLNGRATKILVIHKGKKRLLWQPADGTSIEDMILAFAKTNRIDILQEININDEEENDHAL